MRLTAAKVTPHREPALAKQGFMSDDSFLAALGFAESVRIDVSDYEAAEEIFDRPSEEYTRDLIAAAFLTKGDKTEAAVQPLAS